MTLEFESIALHICTINGNEGIWPLPRLLKGAWSGIDVEISSNVHRNLNIGSLGEWFVMITLVYCPFINMLFKHNSLSFGFSWTNEICLRFLACFWCHFSFFPISMQFAIESTSRNRPKMYNGSVFTQSTIVRSPSANGGAGSSTNTYNPNGIDKTRTAHSNDIPSSHLPGWSVYKTDDSAGCTFNSAAANVIVLSLCFALITTMQLN